MTTECNDNQLLFQLENKYTDIVPQYHWVSDYKLK